VEAAAGVEAAAEVEGVEAEVGVAAAAAAAALKRPRSRPQRLPSDGVTLPSEVERNALYRR
jgi:hypothetical protein